MATAQRVAIGVERGDIVQYGRDERWQHGVVADIIGSTAIVHRPKTHSYVKVRVSDIVRIYGQAVVRLLAGSRADLPPGVTRPAPTNQQSKEHHGNTTSTQDTSTQDTTTQGTWQTQSTARPDHHQHH